MSTRDDLRTAGDALSGQLVYQLDILNPTRQRRPGLTPRTSTTSKSTWHEKSNDEVTSPVYDNGKPGHGLRRGSQVSKEHTASLISWLTFNWVTPLIRLGHQRPLEKNDIWPVNHERQSAILADRLSDALARQVAARNPNPLRLALLEVFKPQIFAGGAAQLVSTFIHTLTPFTLRYLIAFAAAVYNARDDHTNQPALSKGIGLVLAITAMQLLQSLCTNHALHYGMLIGALSRAALTASIFKKSMKLSLGAKAGVAAATNVDTEDWSNGRITNLMSSDVSRIDQACSTLHPVWTAPVSILMSLTFLLLNISYGAFFGFLVLAVATPLFGRAMKAALARRSQINRITDSRVTLAQELLQGIKFIKIFGWENTFINRHQELRKQEVATLRRLIDLRNTVMSSSMVIPVLAAAPSFALYAFLNSDVTPARIFSSIGLLNSLRQPLTILPTGISQLLDASISISRIESFLLAKEAADSINFDPEISAAVSLSEAAFRWKATNDHTKPDATKPDATKDAAGKQKGILRVPFERSLSLESQSFSRPLFRSGSKLNVNEHAFELRDISLSIRRDELVAVIGDVGAGKSSLLAALAGHMQQTGGDVTLGAPKAYCAEGAWIQNASIRDNITFGHDFESQWYDDIIDACALRSDLSGFPNGDATEVGERGATLSGGQKQRINMARAIYSGAGVLLMDDPLSAVDPQVGKHIFDHAILRLLRGKCRIIATHQQHVLPACDTIVCLRQGRVQSIDSPARLLAKKRITDSVLRLPDTKSEAKQAEPHATTTSAPSSLMQAEERPTRGGVPVSVYFDYVKSSGTWLSVPIVLGVLVLLQGSVMGASIWLSCWTSHTFDMSDASYLGIYGALGIIQAILMLVFCKSITYFATTASLRLDRQAIASVVRSPMSFFDTTPLGRLTNRFSKEVDTLDNTLADSIRLLLMTTGSTIAVFTLIMTYYRLFVFAILPVLAVYLSLTAYYRSSAREMKYHESTLRSKVFAKSAEAISGVSTIRSYGVQDRFIESLHQAIDDMNSAYILTFSYQRWLAIRLDGVGLFLVVSAGLLAVRSSISVDPSVIGIVVAWIVSVAQMLQFTVRYLTDVDRDMVAVERLQYYGTRLASEEPSATRSRDLPASWPSKGEVLFQNAHLRYRTGLPDALRDFSMHLRPGEHIGIVGRTGAGKSSVIGALLRLVNLNKGRILIDGVDISQIALSDLRSRVTVVTQDPKLFCGTVRFNLDPFDQHSDTELSTALQQVRLSDDIALGSVQTSNMALSLTSMVDEDGMNLSFGQRQLLVLARALVRHTQITIFDEATTAIDFETDEKIQRTVAEAFFGRTLICIAHRLRTVIGFDRICLMDAGQIAEMDTPKNLWQADGSFRRMCDQSGITERDFA